jgi:MFS family permease
MDQKPASLWRHRDFLKLWTADTVSQFGSQISFLAIPFVAIKVLEATPFQIGILNAVNTLPFLLIGLPAGVWVDRMRRRPVLIVGDLGRALVLGWVPIAHVLGILAIWQLYVVGFLMGILTVFFDVAYQSYLPALVERSQLIDGNAKLQISASGAQVAGPPIAGIVIGALTAPIAVLLDALSFLGSAIFIFAIRRHEPAPEKRLDAAGKRTSMLSEMREGLGYVLGHRLLRNIAGATGTSNLFGTMGFTVLLLYLVRELGMSAEVIGLVFGVGSVGFLVGALLPARIQRLIGLGPTIVASIFLGGVSFLLIPLAPRDAAIPFLIVAQLGGGISQVVYNVSQVSLRQAITPDRLQGRMNATMRFLVWGTIPIGSVIGGYLGGTIGLHETLYVGAIGSALAFLFVLLSPVRSLRTIPDAVPDEPAPPAPDVDPMPPGG